MRLFFPIRLAAAGLMIAAVAVQAADKDEAKGVTVDKEKRLVIVDCKVAPRKIDDPAYKEIYPIEVIACWPFRKNPAGGQKAHETVVTFDFSVKPSAVHQAIESLGVKPGKPVIGGIDEPKGHKVGIFLEFAGADGQMKKLPIERTLVNRDNPKLKLPPFEWRFTGSVMKQPDPNKPETVYGADLTGTLISVFPVTDQTVFQTDKTMKDEKYIKMETNTKLLPPVGTAVKLIIQVPPAK